jgi:hypothetical protein
MKSIYKTIFLSLIISTSNIGLAREVILIENQASSSEGELLVNILVNKFKLPRELITLKNTTFPCQKQSDAIIQLCLETNGELIVKKINQFIVKNSLGVFLDQIEGERK